MLVAGTVDLPEGVYFSLHVRQVQAEHKRSVVSLLFCHFLGGRNRNMQSISSFSADVSVHN